jgi:hypothetical protein
MHHIDSRGIRASSLGGTKLDSFQTHIGQRRSQPFSPNSSASVQSSNDLRLRDF